MAQEMNISCNFIEHKLNCILPDNTMDVLLKVRTKSGEHTFREDVYTILCTFLILLVKS